jgi:hypothetical protein
MDTALARRRWLAGERGRGRPEMGQSPQRFRVEIKAYLRSLRLAARKVVLWPSRLPVPAGGHRRVRCFDFDHLGAHIPRNMVHH